MKNINLKIVEMTESIMQNLEERGLITRLLPSRKEHRIDIPAGAGLGVPVYVSNAETGTHSLVRCTIDFKSFKNFGIHNGSEEFLLLGGVGEQDLLLLIAYDKEEVFRKKFENESLTGDDFICLKCVFNNPNLSFFVMHEGVAHGESVTGYGLPATFYVTEGSKLGRSDFDLDKRFKLCVSV